MKSRSYAAYDTASKKAMSSSAGASQGDRPSQPRVSSHRNGSYGRISRPAESSLQVTHSTRASSDDVIAKHDHDDRFVED